MKEEGEKGGLPPVIPHVIGSDGNVYYKCPKCGAVGNWAERIVSGKCHKSVEEEEKGH